MKRLIQFSLSGVLVLILAACGSSEQRPDASGGVDGGDGAKAKPVVIDGVSGVNVRPNSIAGRAPKERIVYFDYDAADVQPEYINIVAQHGRYLSQNPEGRIRLEGHTDERGTREYNIALGEARAKSVARMLQLQGVNANQFRTLSYGEELPVDDGHSPSAWEKNRRVIIVYETD